MEPNTLGSLVLVAVSTATPFVLGGVGYVIHNENRMTTVEQQVVTANKQLSEQGGTISKIYDIMLEDAKRRQKPAVRLPLDHPDIP